MWYDPDRAATTSVYRSSRWHPRAGAMVCTYDADRTLEQDWLTAIHYGCGDCCLTLVVRQWRQQSAPAPCWVGAGAVTEPVALGTIEGALVRGRWVAAAAADAGESQVLTWSADDEYAALRWAGCGWGFELRARGEDGGFAHDELATIAQDMAKQLACR
jgi:hypothetical protein